MARFFRNSSMIVIRFDSIFLSTKGYFFLLESTTYTESCVREILEKKDGQKGVKRQIDGIGDSVKILLDFQDWPEFDGGINSSGIPAVLYELRTRTR